MTAHIEKPDATAALDERLAKMKVGGMTIKGLVESVGNVMVELFRPFSKRLKTVEDRIAEVERGLAELQRGLEQRSYQGTYDDTSAYQRHNMTTHGGSLWIALRDNADIPGTTDSWKLAVKRGRDARGIR